MPCHAMLNASTQQQRTNFEALQFLDITQLYDVRLNSCRRGHCRAHRSPIVCSKKSNASKPLTIVIRLLDIGVHGWKEALRNDGTPALSLFSRDRLPLRIPAIVAYNRLGSLHSTICLTSTLSTHSFS
ncbi:unnamed protein product [Nippostrongylus brasiliensis]|uniref:Uncharacterized protein n=1 Tax=Nippostrongylus brasiliensis TaxID=27835 RepID=A0A0N4YCY8_NIPBR|nr:unnamed protein product [Nippostrongylus brasiliensis]